MYWKTHTIKMLISSPMVQRYSIGSVLSYSVSPVGLIVFVKNDQLILILMLKCRRLRIAKIILKKKTERFSNIF